MIHYVHSIDPIAFSMFGAPFPWYWIVYFLGYFWILYSIKLIPAKYLNISQAKFHQYVFGGFFSMLFAAKLFYVLLYNFSEYANEPLKVLRVWEGGMSFHGAILGITLWSLYFAKKERVNFFHLTDIVSTSAAIVLFFGRMANFANGELAGRVSDVSWAIIFPRYMDGQARHPSQIYEAAGEGLVLFIILWSKKEYLLDFGRQSIRFLFFYGIIRFVCEFWREADSQIGYILYLSVGQIYCLLMIVFSFVLFIKKRI